MGLKHARLFSILFIASLILKLVLAYYIPLSFDEAYYWVWSHHPQLSYFDHPGFISWLLWLGQPLENFGNAVRFPAVIFGHLYLIIWYFILKPNFEQSKIWAWLMFCLFCPLLGIGLIIVTPDIPLIFFWSLSILFFIKALEQKNAKYYALLGVSLGLGLCSKYHIVLFLFCIASIIILNPEVRKKIQWRYTLCTIITGLIFSLPVIIWNIENNFISFTFQMNHGLANKKPWEIQWTVEYVLGQIFILSPIVFIKCIKSNASNEGPKIPDFFYSFAFVPFIFFFITSFKSTIEPNWPVVGYLSAFVLILNGSQILKIFRNYTLYWVVMYLVLTIAIFQKNWHWADKLREPHHFDSLYEIANEYRPVYADSYQMAAKLWFELKQPIYKLKGMSRTDFFDFLEKSDPSKGNNKDHFYLIKDIDYELPEWILKTSYKIKKIKSINTRFELLEFTRS